MLWRFAAAMRRAYERATGRRVPGGSVRLRLRGQFRIERRRRGELVEVRERDIDGEELENLVVNAGLDAIKDRMFNGSTTVPVFGWIAAGTGTTTEDAEDEELETEVTRVAATYEAAGTGACIVKATLPDGVGEGPWALTEAGILNDADAGEGVLLNRKVFDAVNKTEDDAIMFVWTLTFTAAD